MAGKLKEVFGGHVDLTGEDGSSESYKILAELESEGRSYAILQTKAMAKDGEIEVFRIAAETDGEIQLETVEDDDEWERIAEAYDDLQFGGDERP